MASIDGPSMDNLPNHIAEQLEFHDAATIRRIWLDCDQPRHRSWMVLGGRDPTWHYQQCIRNSSRLKRPVSW